MLDTFIIKRIQEEKKRPDRRPTLEVDTPYRRPNPDHQKSAKVESNRGVAIIDFSI